MLLERMAQNPLFSSLPASTREFLAGNAISRKLVKNQILALSGENWPYLLLVGEGSLRAVKESSEGRSLVVSTFHPPELFWGLSFFDGESLMPVTLVAVEKSWVYLWGREVLTPTLKADSEMSWKLCQILVERMKQASMIVEEMAFQPVDRRLARLLLERFTDAENDSLERRMTLDEMAAQIGTTREMVCRILYRFSHNEMIRVTRTEFVLTDRSGLKILAER